MKRAELIRNVTAIMATTAFSFSMFCGFIAGLLTTTENMISLGLCAVISGIAAVMHHIAK